MSIPAWRARSNLVRRFGWAVVAAIVAVPSVEVISALEPTRWVAAAVILRDLGLVTGALGLGLLAAVTLLGLRSPVLERALGPLDRMIRFHHVMGVAAYVMILSHPLWLAAAASVHSWRAAGRLLFGVDDLAIILGWLSLILLVTVVLSSVATRLGHESRRRAHLLGWLAAGLAVAHGVVARGVRAGDVLLIGVLLLAVGWRLRRSLFHAGEHPYRVADVRRVARGFVELHLDPIDRAMHARPGQFVFVRFLDPRGPWKCREYHPFTISSAPHEPRLRLVVKALGDCTARLLELTTGAMARVDGPYGELFPSATSPARQVWLAGGVGVTPFLSAARALGSGTTVDLFYCTKRAEDAVFQDELEQLARDHPSLRIHHHVDEAAGLLTADRVIASSPDGRAADFFIAGPPSFSSALRRGLRNAGVPAARIHGERFEHL